MVFNKDIFLYLIKIFNKDINNDQPGKTLS